MRPVATSAGFAHPEPVALFWTGVLGLEVVEEEVEVVEEALGLGAPDRPPERVRQRGWERWNRLAPALRAGEVRVLSSAGRGARSSHFPPI